MPEFGCGAHLRGFLYVGIPPRARIKLDHRDQGRGKWAHHIAATVPSLNNPSSIRRPRRASCSQADGCFRRCFHVAVDVSTWPISAG